MHMTEGLRSILTKYWSGHGLTDLTACYGSGIPFLSFYIFFGSSIHTYMKAFPAVLAAFRVSNACLASSPVPLFSHAGRWCRALRGEEKRRAWYTLFAHASKSLGILRLRGMARIFSDIFVIIMAMS